MRLEMRREADGDSDAGALHGLPEEAEEETKGADMKIEKQYWNGWAMLYVLSIAASVPLHVWVWHDLHERLVWANLSLFPIFMLRSAWRVSTGQTKKKVK